MNIVHVDFVTVKRCEGDFDNERVGWKGDRRHLHLFPVVQIVVRFRS